MEGRRQAPPYDAYHLQRGMGQLWQADHIRPLIEANGDLSFYLLANLQTLCTKCHLAKGAEDRQRRKAQDVG